MRETTWRGEPVGAPVTARDGNDDTATHTLDDAGETFSDIDKRTGQLLTQARLDREARRELCPRSACQASNPGARARVACEVATIIV